jgi:integrase
MTQTEVRAFFRVIHRPRDHALFTLVYLYGLRVSEVSLLEKEDVDLVRGRIVVRRVKNGVWTERPLFSSARESLARYLMTAPASSAGPLFAGREGPLQKRQIQTLFARYRERARLSRRYTCHSLRHSIATHLLDAGMPLEFVQDHLGHRNIKSTTIYARITDRYRSAQFRRLENSPWIVHPARNTTQNRKENPCEESSTTDSSTEDAG